MFKAFGREEVTAMTGTTYLAPGWVGEMGPAAGGGEFDTVPVRHREGKAPSR